MPGDDADAGEDRDAGEAGGAEEVGCAGEADGAGGAGDAGEVGDAGEGRREGEAGDAGDGSDPPENRSDRFDRLPATAEERVVEGRATCREVLEWWEERFGVDPAVFADHTFWERGAGKVWAYAGAAESPTAVEALGMTFLRTRQEHWKPTLEAVQRFSEHATENVIELSRAEAVTFLAGEDQVLDWDGDWGYLVVTHELAGEWEPLGVGLYVYGELRSQVPKGRRRDLR